MNRQKARLLAGVAVLTVLTVLPIRILTGLTMLLTALLSSRHQLQCHHAQD